MMNAGSYYVGDLCYVIENDTVWGEICDLLDGEGGEFTLNDGRKIHILHTAYGDGTYTDQYGNLYPVDSGTIGCMLASDCDKLDAGSNVIEFERDFDCDDDSGVLTFGHISINTGFSDSDYDDYSEYDDDDNDLDSDTIVHDPYSED